MTWRVSVKPEIIVWFHGVVKLSSHRYANMIRSQRFSMSILDLERPLTLYSKFRHDSCLSQKVYKPIRTLSPRQQHCLRGRGFRLQMCCFLHGHLQLWCNVRDKQTWRRVYLTVVTHLGTSQILNAFTNLAICTIKWKIQSFKVLMPDILEYIQNQMFSAKQAFL